MMQYSNCPDKQTSQSVGFAFLSAYLTIRTSIIDMSESSPHIPLPGTCTVHGVSDRLDVHAPQINDSNGSLLEEGVFAPSEHDRLLREYQELLRRRYNRRSTGSAARPLDIAAPVASGSDASVHGYGTNAASIEAEWDEAVRERDLDTSPMLELRTLAKNAAPHSVTFFLQYSLFMFSLLFVGHLGKVELGAVSLGTMTACITGVAFVQGMATCVDTLCPQAYGAGRLGLVGLYFQKGVLLVAIGLLPVMVLWYNADIFLPYIVASDHDSPQLMEMATKYLQMMICTMPGFTVFECSKRVLQSQGIFHASTLMLVVCAPMNFLLTWTLVWNEKIGIGFLGAPLAISITNTVMACLLLSYVVFVDGRQCWHGFTWRAIHNWDALIQLAVPGLIMVESEFLAYEIMTLAASYLGTTELAAQTIMSSVTAMVYEIPFAIGCAVATRIANFIGADMIPAAKLVVRVAVLFVLAIGLMNGTLLFVIRSKLAGMFTQDPTVLHMAIKHLPMCSVIHALDSVACVLAGILRGQGRQDIGGYINLASYYAIGVPLGLYLCFCRWQLGLAGLWCVFYAALGTVIMLSLLVLQRSNWTAYTVKARANNV